MNISRREFIKLVGMGTAILACPKTLIAQGPPGIIHGKDATLTMGEVPLFPGNGGFLVPREYIQPLLKAAGDNRAIRMRPRTIRLP